MESLLPYSAIFSWLAVLVIAALSGMGVGGGGLFVLYLTYTTALPQATAQGTNLLFFLLSSAAALPLHLRSRRIYLPAVCVMILTGAVGVLLGTWISSLLSATLLRRCFGVMLVAGGILSLQGKGERP